MFQVVSPQLDQLITRFRGLGGKVSQALAVGVEQTTQQAHTEVINMWRNQGPGWQDISPRWRAWKIKHTFSPRILIMTGFLLGNISSKRISRFMGRVYVKNATYPALYRHFTAGSKLRKKFRSAGSPSKTTTQVGWIHEGADGTGKRPFMSPVAYMMYRRSTTLFRNLISAALT